MANKGYIGVPKTSRLDAPYIELEYIESTGTQYIDTGIVPKYTDSIVAKIRCIANTTTKYVFGCAGTASTSSRSFAFLASNSGYYVFHVGGGNVNFPTSCNTDKPFLLDYNSINNLGISLDHYNTGFANLENYQYMPTTSIALFGRKNYSGTINYSSCAIYSFKMRDKDENLLRDFVPCKNSSGAIGMYDLVSKTFFPNNGTGKFVAGPVVGNTTSSVGVARPLKSIYIGHPTEVNIYERQEVNNTITNSNISNYFTVTNGSTYYFVGSGSVFTSNNKRKASKTATTTLTTLRDMDVSFNYSYSCRSGDYFTLTVAGSTIENGVYSTTTVNKTWSGSLKQGDVISFKYSKNASLNGGEDQCTFSNMVVSYTDVVNLGPTLKNVARIIRKAYVGVGGFARPCYSTELEYFGYKYLSKARSNLAATAVGSYALFGGGLDNNGGNFCKDVDAFDTSLTRIDAVQNLSGSKEVAYLAATTLGNYALFGGGCQAYSGLTLLTNDFVVIFDKSLTRVDRLRLSQGRGNLAATSTKDYAIFAGGEWVNSTTKYDTVDAFDESLTLFTADPLSTVRYELSGTSIGDYAIFAGGWVGSNSTDVVEVYDNSLTKLMADNLHASLGQVAATTVGNYALFVASGSSADAYDNYLTHILADPLSSKRREAKATTVGCYAIIGAGYSAGYIRNTEAYDIHLTRTSTTSMSNAVYDYAATTVGNYALFGGGINSSGTRYSTVDIYTA